MSRRKKTYYGDGADVAAQDDAEKSNPYSKYRAKRTTIDGITFASKMESRRYLILKAMEERGEIRNLRLQPRFRLEVNGIKICDYIGDFQYEDAETGETVTEDCKSKATITPVYRVKRNLMLALHGITILETTA